MSRRSVRRLCSESLETREVLAGNVNVVLSGHNLTITGDESANTIAITQTTATKTVRVEGRFTNIFLNGGGSAAFQEINVADFAKLNVKIVTKEGFDFLTIGQAVGDRVTFAKLTIDTGAGSDGVAMQRVDVTGAGTNQITLGKNSEVDADNLNIVESGFAGDLKVRSGDGDDQVLVVTNTNVAGKLDIDCFKGNDAVAVQNGTHGAVSVKLGDGNDTAASLWNLNVTAGKLSLDTGNGSEVQVILNNVTAAKNVSINLGTDAAADANTLGVTGLTSSTKVTIRGGKGADNVALNTLHAPVIDVKLGEAADVLNINGLAADGALNSATKLSIALGAGDDLFTTATNIRAATIDVKLGDGANRMSADGATAAKKIKVASGKDADLVIVTNITAPDLFIDLGDNGNDVLTASLLNVGVNGKLTVKGGAGIGDTLNFNTAGSTIPPFNAILKSGFEVENIT